MSRITQFTNPLGVFTQTYDPVNLMPETLTAPNGLTTTLDYHPAAADLRLKEIKHTLTGNVALSKHVYGYKPAGNIDSWAQTLGTSAAKTRAIAYDKADQLEAATQTQSGAVTAQQAFRFDRIGNITSKQDGSEISKGTFNNRNQLTAQEPGGWMRVRGTTNEGASVKVKSNANPFTNAATTSADEFSAWVQAAPGANTVTVEAKDDSPNANTRTQSWSVNITGQSRTPTYDFNGNMTANGLGQTYLWDAENRLVKITYADNSKTEFTYDGRSRRVRITERNASNTITGDKRYLWAGGNQSAEEREANGTTVTKRYFPQGEQRIGGADAGFYYYTKDHLGSIREITNSSGALATRYDFDLWGKRTKLSGSMETDVGFTGHHHHAKSGLVLTWFRAYDAEAGRWLSPDPIEEEGGLNLYGYVGGDPINHLDLFGLDRWFFTNMGGIHTGIVIEDPTSTTGYRAFNSAINGMDCYEVDKPDGPPSTKTSPEEDSFAVEYLLDECNKRKAGIKMDLEYGIFTNKCKHQAAFWSIVGTKRGGDIGRLFMIHLPLIPIDPTEETPEENEAYRKKCEEFAKQGRIYGECCFIAGTQITMADGSQKNIEDVSVGDKVASWDEHSGEVVVGSVENTMSPMNEDLVEIVFGTLAHTTNTADHPFFVIGKGWCSVNPSLTKNRYIAFRGERVGNLTIGDKCWILKNNKLDKAEITTIQPCDSKSVNTYNFRVSRYHCYFANGILVHNK